MPEFFRASLKNVCEFQKKSAKSQKLKVSSEKKTKKNIAERHVIDASYVGLKFTSHQCIVFGKLLPKSEFIDL